MGASDSPEELDSDDAGGGVHEGVVEQAALIIGKRIRGPWRLPHVAGVGGDALATEDPHVL